MPWYGVNHVEVVGSELHEDEIIEFYTGIFGFDILRKLYMTDGKTVYWLDDGTYSQLVYVIVPEAEIETRPQMSGDEDVESLNHDPTQDNFIMGTNVISWGVQDKEELASITTLLEEHDVNYSRVGDAAERISSIHLRDPNGLAIIVQSGRSPLEDKPDPLTEHSSRLRASWDAEQKKRDNECGGERIAKRLRCSFFRNDTRDSSPAK